MFLTQSPGQVSQRPTRSALQFHRTRARIASDNDLRRINVDLELYRSQRSMPGYNVMGLAKASLEANVRYLAQSLGSEGIRVNGISAGPIKTLAASGIKGLKQMLNFYEDTAPLGRGVTIEEVGNTAAFLCSDLASGITGDHYVDGGFNTVGIGPNVANGS